MAHTPANTKATTNVYVIYQCTYEDYSEDQPLEADVDDTFSDEDDVDTVGDEVDTVEPVVGGGQAPLLTGPPPVQVRQLKLYIPLHVAQEG